MRLSATFLALALLSQSASADIVRTPDCTAKLTRANHLVEAISKRTYVAPAPTGARLCEVLRTNLREMREAIGLMDACMTGRDRAENVGQMSESMGDIQHVISRRCQ
ncbi:MAG: hypothetical protein ABWZ80_04820 [Beijerinckiaceae bacterium]